MLEMLTAPTASAMDEQKQEGEQIGFSVLDVSPPGNPTLHRGLYKIGASAERPFVFVDAGFFRKAQSGPDALADICSALDLEMPSMSFFCPCTWFAMYGSKGSAAAAAAAEGTNAADPSIVEGRVTDLLETLSRSCVQADAWTVLDSAYIMNNCARSIAMARDPEQTVLGTLQVEAAGTPGCNFKGLGGDTSGLLRKFRELATPVSEKVVVISW